MAIKSILSSAQKVQLRQLIIYSIDNDINKSTTKTANTKFGRKKVISHPFRMKLGNRTNFLSQANNLHYIEKCTSYLQLMSRNMLLGSIEIGSNAENRFQKVQILMTKIQIDQSDKIIHVPRQFTIKCNGETRVNMDRISKI